MIIEQLYTKCLAEAAYYIESDGEAAIIDPLRETQPYIDLIQENGVKLKYIFETHFHADFVSGHVDLAQKTGAEIVYGPNANTDYAVYNAEDGEILKLGNLKIKVLHTPGHTLESSCYLLLDENDKEHCVFTGDTLFIGDVGRPDLAINNGLTKEDLAAMLYDSLRSKIMTLPKDTIIYPAHGAGSACGKSMSKETFDTLQNQLQRNYALNVELSKAQFVESVLDGIMPPPAYFALNASINKTGVDQSFDQIIHRGTSRLDIDEFERLSKQDDVLILDTRHQQEFKDGFIPNSLFIGLGGTFAPWVGALIADVNQKMVLVTDQGKEEEAVTRLARVGFDQVLGCLSGGFSTWLSSKKPIDTIESIDPSEFADRRILSKYKTLDVRKPGEYETARLEDSENKPLDFIYDHVHSLDPKQNYLIHCAGGYRSMIYSSILKQHGIHKVVDIKGGFGAIKKEDKIDITEGVSPCSLSK